MKRAKEQGVRAHFLARNIWGGGVRGGVGTPGWD
jgi:hypothetical protein